MKINSIKLSNFLVFGEEVEVTFPSDTDLLLLVNGENGAGKTALFEAVYWAIRGKMVRNIRAEEVLRHGTKKCEVLVDIDDHVVKRAWSKSTKQVWLNGKNWHAASEGTEAIVQALNFDPELLSLVAFCGKRFESFVSMKPGPRAKIIDLISHASIWDDAARRASRSTRELNGKLDILRKEQQKHIDEHVVRKQLLDEVKWDLKCQREAQKKKLVDIEGKRQELKKQVDQEEARREELEKKISEVEDLRMNLTNLITTRDQEKADLRQELRRTDLDIDNINGLLVNNRCPTCEQDLQDIKGKLKIDVARKEEDAEALQKRIEDIEGDTEQLLKDSNALLTELQGYDKEVKDIDDIILAADQQTRQLDLLHAEESHDLDIARLEERVKNMASEIEKAEQSLDDREAMIEETIDYQDAYRFWQDGFKRIRYLRMERVAQGLGKALTSVVTRLGLDADKAEVNLWTDDRRPEIGITLVRGDHRVSVEALSEGEEQKMGFACFIALGTYIKKITGFDPGFRVIDEPFSNLDEDGRHRAFGVIKELHGQKFVMSHNSDFKDLFTNQITVVKQDRVSGVQ